MANSEKTGPLDYLALGVERALSAISGGQQQIMEMESEKALEEYKQRKRAEFARETEEQKFKHQQDLQSERLAIQQSMQEQQREFQKYIAAQQRELQKKRIEIDQKKANMEATRNALSVINNQVKMGIPIADIDKWGEEMMKNYPMLDKDWLKEQALAANVAIERALSEKVETKRAQEYINELERKNEEIELELNKLKLQAQQTEAAMSIQTIVEQIRSIIPQDGKPWPQEVTDKIYALNAELYNRYDVVYNPNENALYTPKGEKISLSGKVEQPPPKAKPAAKSLVNSVEGKKRFITALKEKFKEDPSKARIWAASLSSSQKKTFGITDKDINEILAREEFQAPEEQAPQVGGITVLPGL